MSKYEVPPEHGLYQSYSVEEEIERINVHYECPPEFYYRFIGGYWNCYSAVLWDNPDNSPEMTVRQAEEAKLDMLAARLELRPGMRVLDVGAGWGGPLTYLCQKYGCTGVGLMLSAKQQEAATRRAAEHGVDAKFVVSHWQQYTDPTPFDAALTDEVTVHFNDLQGFFVKVASLLRVGGMYLDKELHYTHRAYTTMNRAMEHINAVYGFTGNYRLLYEQLQQLHDAGFELASLSQIPLEHYKKTMDGWISRFFQYEADLIALSNREFARNFRKYMKLVRIGFNTNVMSMDVMVGRKL